MNDATWFKHGMPEYVASTYLVSPSNLIDFMHFRCGSHNWGWLHLMGTWVRGFICLAHLVFAASLHVPDNSRLPFAADKCVGRVVCCQYCAHASCIMVHVQVEALQGGQKLLCNCTWLPLHHQIKIRPAFWLTIGLSVTPNNAEAL